MNLFRTYQSQISFFFLCMWAIGMFIIDYARIVPSIAMIGLALSALLSVKPSLLFANFKNNKSMLALSGTFLILLPSVFYSDNLKYFNEKLLLILPFFILSFAYASLPKLSENKIRVLYLLFITGVLATSFMAFLFYLANQAEVNQLYLESRVMPTWVSHHPTFSLMIALAGYFSYQLSKTEKTISLKIGLLISTFFLFIFIHIYSVRGGMLAMYALVFLELYHIIVPKRDYKKAALSLTVCILMGTFTYYLSPTIRNKIANTQNDLNNYQQGKSANNQSLGSRFISWGNAIEISNQTSLFFGCGLGDIEDLNNKIFKEKYPEIEKKIIPHNQFLYYLAAIGLIGTIIFAICFYFPLFTNLSNRFLLAHYIVISIAFLGEAFLTTQLGAAFSLFFILLLSRKQ